jgi:hypothetical protein
MAEDLIRYDLLVQDALRGVVRKVLDDAGRDGLPGDHHFYISFKTRAPGVKLSSRVREKWPDEMTIILQHQFWGLRANDEAFEVGLSFANVPETLVIPYDSITAFNDPSVPFGFKLEPRDSSEAAPGDAVKQLAPKRQPAPGAPSPSPPAAMPAPVKAKSAAPPAAPDRPKEPARLPVEPRKKAEPASPAKVVSIDAFRKK